MYNLNDNKRWYILIIIIFVLILGVVIPLATMVPKKSKVETNIEKENEPKDDIEVVVDVEKTPQVSPYEEAENTKEEEVEEFDPYEKYKDIVWCGSEDTIKTVVIYAEQDGLNIKNTTNDEFEKWQTDIGAKKVHFNGSKNEAIMLSNDGKVYKVTAEGYEVVKALENYNIIDMAYITKNKKSEFYFLTENGKLIDITREPYDKPEFINTLTYGDIWKLYLDKEGHIYIKDEVELEYKPITTNIKLKLKVAKIYVFSNYIAIETTGKKLFGCYRNNTVAILSSTSKLSKVQRTIIDGEEYIIYIYADGTSEKSINPLGAFNVAENKKIDLKTLDPSNKKSNLTKEQLAVIQKIVDNARKNLLSAYDGMEMNGKEVLYTFSQVAEDDVDFSVVLISKENGAAYSGQYKLDVKDLKASNKSSAETITKHKIYSKGVYFMGKEESFDSSVKRILSRELEHYFDVSNERTYYSSLIRDKSGKEIGILFMEK